MDQEKCPCCSGKNYADCCEKIIRGVREAATPEELMRARYTAYAKGEVDFLVESTHPAQRKEVDRKEVEEWSATSTWLGLEILKAETPAPDAEKGEVEFSAYYTDAKGTKIDHHELSDFRKADGKWYFYDGKIAPQKPYRAPEKINRNAPCPCGSGKKYKKCCGR